MKVTPVKKKFGKYQPEVDAFDLPDKAARVFIKINRLREVTEANPLGYQTRMMQAVSESAPYGYKADGTPKKRPGRPATNDE